MIDARTIDFRETYWGHNLQISTESEGVLSGFCWSSPGPRKGDRILWRAEYGYAVAEVTSSEWTINVDDMFAIEVRVIERRDKDDRVLWRLFDGCEAP